MAKNVKINGVTYASVPQVEIPMATGGGNATFYDTGDATITANDLRKNKTGYGPSGAVQGNLETISASTEEITAKAQEVTIAAGIHSGTGKVKLSSAAQAALVSGNIRAGVEILGVSGSLSSVSVAQDSSTKVLTIS